MSPVGETVFWFYPICKKFSEGSNMTQRVYFILVSNTQIRRLGSRILAQYDDESIRVREVTRVAFADHLGLDADSLHFANAQPPISLRHNSELFSSTLQRLNSEWKADFNAAFTELHKALNDGSVHPNDDVIDPNATGVEALISIAMRLMKKTVEMLYPRDKKPLVLNRKKWTSKTALIEALGKVSWFYSGKFDDASSFYDLEREAAFVPELDELHLRTDADSDYWLVPLSIQF
jgi:hypothetical protein